jgi:hypothetical protein
MATITCDKIYTRNPKSWSTQSNTLYIGDDKEEGYYCISGILSNSTY